MRRRGDRGAVLPLVAICITLLMTMAAFGVDLGMQRVVRRDMQALADAVALDLARLVDGRTASQIRNGLAAPEKPSLEEARADSVARNDDHTLGSTPVVTAVLVRLDPQGRPVRDASGDVVSLTGIELPDAVYVTATADVDFTFTDGSGAATRSAIGQSESEACFRLGSFALNLNSQNSALLNRLVGDALDISGIAYTGLATAKISLLELAVELGVGTVEELASLEGVQLSRLFVAAARVLARDDPHAAQVDLLNSLSARIGSLAVDLGQLVAVGTGSSKALDAELNLLDLVAASAFAANGEDALGLDVLWNEPHLAVGAPAPRLRIVQRPQLACGRVDEAVAHTAQVLLDGRLRLQPPSKILGLDVTGTDVVLDLEVAGATGRLTGISCATSTGQPESITVAVEKELLRLQVAAGVRLSGSTELRLGDLGLGALDGLLGLLSLDSLVHVALDVSVGLGVATSSPAAAPGGGLEETYAVPPEDYTRPVPVGDPGPIQLPPPTLEATDVSGTATVRLAGTDLAVPLTGLGDVLDELTDRLMTPALVPLVASLNALLGPLSDLLGISANGADLFGVPHPTCDRPALRG